MTKRQEFSKAVKVEIIKRATVNGVVYCEQCGIAAKRFDIDHSKPDGMRIDKTASLTAEDGKLLCAGKKNTCHGIKTAADVEAIARAKRVEAKHIRAVMPAAPIRSAPMPTTERAAKRQSKPPVVRQFQLYRDI